MSDMKRREFITLRSDPADPAWRWMSLSWLAVVIGCLYIQVSLHWRRSSS
jgi:hypothetical protein